MVRAGNGGNRFAPLLVEALPLRSNGHLELRRPRPAAVHGEVQRELVQLLDGQVAAGEGGVHVGVHGGDVDGGAHAHDGHDAPVAHAQTRVGSRRRPVGTRASRASNGVRVSGASVIITGRTGPQIMVVLSEGPRDPHAFEGCVGGVE